MTVCSIIAIIKKLMQNFVDIYVCVDFLHTNIFLFVTQQLCYEMRRIKYQ